jgi:hypothetical protein
MCGTPSPLFPTVPPAILKVPRNGKWVGNTPTDLILIEAEFYGGSSD